MYTGVTLHFRIQHKYSLYLNLVTSKAPADLVRLTFRLVVSTTTYTIKYHGHLALAVANCVGFMEGLTILQHRLL